MNASTDCSGVIGSPISVSSPASTRLEIGSESTSTPSQSKMTARMRVSGRGRRGRSRRGSARGRRPGRDTACGVAPAAAQPGRADRQPAPAVAPLQRHARAAQHRQHAPGDGADGRAAEQRAPSRTARVPPVGAPGSSGGGPSGGGSSPVVIEVKNAHESNSPKRARSCPPVTRVRPRVPMTSASTIRGERPRRTTSMPRKRPLTEEPSLRAGLLEAHPDRAPAVARGGVVVGIVDRLQPRPRLVAERRVLDVLGAPAGGREEVGHDRLAVVGDDLAAGLAHRLVRRGLLGRHAAVDLRARVGVEVERRRRASSSRPRRCGPRRPAP